MTDPTLSTSSSPTMKLFTSILFIIHFAPVHGSWEFGRDQGHGEIPSTKRILGREQANSQFEQPIKVELPIDDVMEDSLQEFADSRVLMDLPMSMSMQVSLSMSLELYLSMSMSMTDPPYIPSPGPSPPVTPPTPPPVPVIPTSSVPTGSNSPSISPNPVPSIAPISLPSATPGLPSSSSPSTPSPSMVTFSPVAPNRPTEDISAFPSDGPSLSPSVGPSDLPTLSVGPSMTSIPTTAPVSPAVDPEPPTETTTSEPPVSDGDSLCSIDDELTVGSPEDNFTAPIFLAVGYSVESTANATTAFVTELENALVDTAIVAVLGCEGTNTTDKVFPTTILVAECDPSLSNAMSCFIMETEVIIFFKGPVDEDEAVYKAYSAIKDSMTKEGGYVGTIPTIVKLEFLSPSPLPIPPGSEVGGNSTGVPVSSVESNANSSGTSSSGVNPWTIGASVAILMGGLVSAVVYARSRHLHRSRQQLLSDEMDLMNGISGDGDPISGE